jgi:hypothetical protein
MHVLRAPIVSAVGAGARRFQYKIRINCSALCCDLRKH